MTTPAVFCNPMDLSYRLQNTHSRNRGTAVFREAADPSVVVFQGRYYLFASMSGGFWHSTDLRDWSFVGTPELPTYDYAPDVREVDGQLVVCASRRGATCSFYRTADPLSGVWETIPGTMSFWDPNLFQDDDGRLYLYEGCSANTPIRGVELDRGTFAPIGKRVDLIGSRTRSHGWETPGIDWDLSTYRPPLFLRLFFGRRPFIEGAWMTKHEGRYYLQYSAPATEQNTYSDGYYVGDSPLGPFTYGQASPFSSKPGGFMTAAGHGSTFQDLHGNWWHVASMRISVHHDFERRLGLFPAGFTEDGVLFCNQEFADHPVLLPDGPADPWSLTGQFPLLTAGATATASSAAEGHPAALAVEEDVRTWWRAATPAAGQWLRVDLPAAAAVTAIQVNTIEDVDRPQPPAADRAHKNVLGTRISDHDDVPSPFILEVSADGETWEVVRDATTDGRPHDLTVLEEPRVLRAVRVTGGTQPAGATFALSGLRVFGRSDGGSPAQVTASATRIDDVTARVTWTPVDGAAGYNVRYGTSPHQLTHCWQVADVDFLTVRSLNAGVDYWVAVDSFNAGGTTRGSAVPAAHRG